MSSNEEILAMLIAGIPRISERIARLTGQQKPKAFKPVELSYWQAAMDLDYAEDDARRLVGAVMDTLLAETAQQAGDVKSPLMTTVLPLSNAS